jgi:hypothetical protein
VLLFLDLGISATCVPRILVKWPESKMASKKDMPTASKQSSLPAVLVSTILFSGAGNSIAQQKTGTTPLGSPLQMRLCVDNPCETLTWRGSYYDGVKDNSSDISTHYTLEQWSAGGIRLRGKSAAPVSVGQQRVGPIGIATRTYIEAEFSGVIALDGHSVDQAVVHWQVGKLKGEKLYKLTWKEAEGSTASSTCPEGSAIQSPPAALEVCDGGCILGRDGNLGAWMFQGNVGTGDWVAGSRARLRITEWVGSKIEISAKTFQIRRQPESR